MITKAHCVLSFIALAAMSAQAHASFLGQTMSMTSYYPDLDSLIFGPFNLVAGAGVEFSGTVRDVGGNVIFNGPAIDIADSSITADYSVLGVSGTFLGADFNGFVFSDVFGTVPDIVSVTIDEAVTTFAFAPEDIWFTADSIFLNFENLAFNQSSFWKLDVEFAPSAVPVPAAAWLFGSGLLGVIGVTKRKAV